MTFKKQSWEPASMIDALQNGIGMVVQESGTISGVTVAENIFLAELSQFRNKLGMINKKAMNQKATEAMRAIGVEHVIGDMPIDSLDFQTRKLVEIAKVMLKNPDILVIDETSTALSQDGREIMYSLIRKLRDSGKAIIFISHDLEEIMEVCDTLTVLRDGNLNPKTKIWDGVNAEFTPYSDDLPWCMIPEKKITVEDVKYVLSSHYQGTSYDPYASYGEKEQRGAFRSIGVNRTDFLSLIQMRPGMEKDCNILEWVAFASNAFNVLVPFYATIDTTPDYFSSTTREVTTDSFYWVSRMIGAMADASYKSSIFHIERYQERVMSKGHQLIGKYDALLEKESDAAKRMSLRHQANQEIADMVKKEASDTLNKVLYELSNQMKNAYSRSDA